jgi:exopolyphosphatase / guanosine-5'-triphosphate,3'-diphosphate pyrophosphatase
MSRYAALDLGTNNCRLLIAEPMKSSPQGFYVMDAFSRIVRLGEGLTRSHNLSEEAMRRAIEALAICQNKIAAHGVVEYRAVTTEACRKAQNGDAFIARVKQETGLDLKIITTAEEAWFAMMGCLPLMRLDAPYAIVFDIGGGSTEVMWAHIENGRAPKLIDHVSIPYGVVNLTEEFGMDRLSDTDYELMKDKISGELLPFARRHAISDHIRDGHVQMIGCSGTVTTLAAVHLGLSRYQRSVIDGVTMQRHDALTVTENLRVMSYAERKAISCIGVDRADLLIAGCAILASLCEIWPIHEFRIGDRGLREGILTELIRKAG